MAPKNPCSVHGCDAPSRARTWCFRHYRIFRRHGDPTAPVRLKRPAGLSLREAFEFGGPIAADESGCRIWPHGTNSDGYAVIWAEGKSHYGHTAAYRLYNGEIPKGMEVDHKCRVRACVNPSHLRLATSSQNSQNQGLRKDSTTGVRGVRRTASGRFQARVVHNRVVVFQRNFATLEEAEAEVIAARNKFFTHNVDDRVLDTRMAA